MAQPPEVHEDHACRPRTGGPDSRLYSSEHTELTNMRSGPPPQGTLSHRYRLGATLDPCSTNRCLRPVTAAHAALLRPATQPPHTWQLALARAWAQFWAHSPPSAAVHRRPPRACPRTSRTVTDIGERWPALLESVLGASPRGFESRILRHPDLLKHRSSVPTGWRLELRWAQLLVSTSSVGWVPPLGFAALLHLVTGIADRPERRAHAAKACWGNPCEARLRCCRLATVRELVPTSQVCHRARRPGPHHHLDQGKEMACYAASPSPPASRCNSVTGTSPGRPGW